MSSRLEMVALFLFSTTMMALKPLLLHMTRDEQQGNDTLQPEIFQLMVEGLKVMIAIVAISARWLTGKRPQAWHGVRHTATFALPAIVYLLMNVMAVYAARLLKPPTFQLLANMKIMCTAFASWLLLGRRLTVLQWCAMALLTAGIAISQFTWDESIAAPPATGAIIMFYCSCLSAVGGVLTERALKSRGSSSMSIFETNLHLAIHTLAINFVVQSLRQGSLLDLFSFPMPGKALAVSLLNEAGNGILISTIMRRADSIVKNYAFSASTFVTAGLSALFLAYWPPLQFFIGAALTVTSIVLYTHKSNSVEAQSKKA